MAGAPARSVAVSDGRRDGLCGLPGWMEPARALCACHHRYELRMRGVVSVRGTVCASTRCDAIRGSKTSLQCLAVVGRHVVRLSLSFQDGHRILARLVHVLDC